MGKSRSKSKLHSLRSPLVCSQPIDINTINDELLDEIMKKLMSGKPSDRHLGAEMISNSISNFDDYKKEELVELIRTLSPLCCDRAENVRFASTDALCHLSSMSDGLCDLMIDSDVMTPLINLFNKLNQNDWNNQKNCQLFPDIYINSCRLLTNLCGSSNKALKLFNNSNLSQVLMKGLKYFKGNIEVSIASAQCLSVVVEENIIPDLLKEENIDLFKSLLMSLGESAQHMHLSNYMAVIAINLSQKLGSEDLNLIFNVINSTLSVSVLQQLTQLSLNIRELENGKPNDVLKQSYEELKNILLAKRVSLELLTNITSFDDNCSDEDMMDCDDNDSEDEDLTAENGVNIDDNQLNISPELKQRILDESILSKIAEHLSSVGNELRDNLMKHNFGKEILNCIESVQECSLACIHNLVLNISDEKLGINEDIWNRIHSIAFLSNRFNLIEESANTMRAIITQYTQINLTSDELEKLCIVCHNKSASNTLKINVIKLMSVLAERSTDLLFIEKIALLLITALQSESDLVIRAEIFDAIIDIFSEDFKTDEIANKIDLIKKLKESSLIFKKEANKSRQKSKQNPIISTVKLNLMRFIQYKEKMLYKDNRV